MNINYDSNSCDESEGLSEENLLETLKNKPPITYDHPRFKAMIQRII